MKLKFLHQKIEIKTYLNFVQKNLKQFIFLQVQQKLMKLKIVSNYLKKEKLILCIAYQPIHVMMKM